MPKRDWSIEPLTGGKSLLYLYQEAHVLDHPPHRRGRRAAHRPDLGGVHAVSRGSGPDLSTSRGASAVFTAHVLDKLKDPDSLGLVAEMGAEGRSRKKRAIVGYCLAQLRDKPPVFVHRRHGLISDLAVVDSHRRKRIGEGLFQDAREWMKEKGVERIEVRTVSANPASNAFWGKMGFATFAEEKFLGVD